MTTAAFPSLNRLVDRLLGTGVPEFRMAAQAKDRRVLAFNDATNQTVGEMTGFTVLFFHWLMNIARLVFVRQVRMTLDTRFLDPCRGSRRRGAARNQRHNTQD
jgi:hypothetical protein